MDSRNKRIFKLLSLLISALVIGTASAYTYNMFMTSTVGVNAFGMSFVANEDDFSICGGEIATDLQSVTFATMNGLPGSPVTYVPVNIHCADADGHHIELKVDTYGDNPDLNSIKITMYNGATKMGETIELYPTGGGTPVLTTGSVAISNGATWNVEWIVDWKDTATQGTDSVQVALILVVAD